MDIYYFYNGINNIINLISKNEKYLNYYESILNDPLVILDFKDFKNLKGGTSLINKGAKMFGKKGISNKSKDNGESSSKNKSTKQQNKNENNSNNNEKTTSIEKVLKILKVLFSIVYYLCLFSILPLLPFIAISYYSFKRMKTFYNKQMGTL